MVNQTLIPAIHICPVPSVCKHLNVFYYYEDYTLPLDPQGSLQPRMYTQLSTTKNKNLKKKE